MSIRPPHQDETPGQYLGYVFDETGSIFAVIRAWLAYRRKWR